MTNIDHFPPSEQNGGWHVEDPEALGVNADRLNRAINAHDHNDFFTGRNGGALVIIYRGTLSARAM